MYKNIDIYQTICCALLFESLLRYPLGQLER
jgi:hypothetical protein